MARSRTRHATLAVVVALALAACSGESDEQLLNSARGYVTARDYRAATIQLKALLQRSPNSAQGRLLLGRTLFETGDPVAAVVELDKARELGAADEEVVPELAKALLASNDAQRVIRQFGSTHLQPPLARAELFTSLAAAHALQNELPQAYDFARRALAVQPGHAPALLVEARLKMGEGDLDSALKLLDEVLARDPANTRAGVMKGELLWFGKREPELALAELRRVTAANPKSVPAYVAQVSILSRQGKTDEAKAVHAKLREVAPAHPDTLFIEAQLAYGDGNDTAVRNIAAQMLKALPDNPRVLLLAGASALRARSYVQAEAHLARVVKVAPGTTTARHLLAHTYLRAGQPAKAIEVLEPAIDGKHVDGASLALAGDAYMQLGDMKRADDLYRRAGKASPDDPRVQTTLALAQYARGETGTAIAQLEGIAAADKGVRADLALISARMNANDRAGALKAVSALAAKMPGRALPDLLRGRILALGNDAAGARAAFEAALQKEAGFFPAVSGLAALDLAAGKPDQARKRIEAVIQADATNAQAHMTLAEIVARTGGAPAEVAKGLAAAVKAAPSNPVPRRALIEQYLRMGDTQAALVAAQDAAAAIPNDLALMDALGRAQLASNDAQQAISTFTKLAALSPRSAHPQVRLADAYMARRDTAAARRALDTALELEPDNFLARRGLAALAIELGKVDEARAVARQMQKAHPKDFTGFMLEGDVERQQRNWLAAAAAYRTALGLARSTDLAIRLHQVLVEAGQRAETDKFAATWQKDFPQDVAFRFYLGDMSLSRGDLPGAEAHYRTVLALQPRNAMAMNNVAWLMAKQGKAGAAKLAEEAVQLLPNRPALLDTLATALAAENEVKRAIEVQKQAVSLNRDNPSLRLNLARLYLRAGDKPHARAELEDLARLGERFPAHREVTELLKTVQ